MTLSFDEILDAAQQRATVDVDVNLDRDRSQRIADLQAEIDNLTDPRLGDGRPAQLREQIEQLRAEAADAFITLRFTALPGPEWADLTAPSLPRPNVAIDSRYGYNYQEVAQAAAVKSGGRLVDGKVESLTEQQWTKLWTALSGHEFGRIIDEVWALNEYTPQQGILTQKKDSLARSADTSN